MYVAVVFTVATVGKPSALTGEWLNIYGIVEYYVVKLLKLMS